MKVVIIGGGTTGWLTSLFVEKYWKGADITLVESSKIGILGAGEGVTPNFGATLKLLNISETDFIAETKSTIKNGLNFINWRGDGNATYHNFMGERNPLIGINNGFHMDARLVAKYFQSLAVSRGIKHIDANVINFKSIDSDIDEVLTDMDLDLKSDFVFDCSGFARLTMTKVYDEKWISYKDDLIVNSALAYFLPQTDIITSNTTTQTNMISMKSGWMWQAPLQHRWGCGYVFNDTYISIDEAKKEIENYIKQPISIVKTFKYDAGYYENFWIGNCVSLGLSSSFLEPLESTSLMTTIMLLKKLSDINFNKKYRNNVNQYYREITEQNMLFVRYHYMCDRNDSEFWKFYKNKPLPNKLQNLLKKDGSPNFTTIDELISKLNLVETKPNTLTFFPSNYNIIYRKNSLKFSNQLL